MYPKMDPFVLLSRPVTGMTACVYCDSKCTFGTCGVCNRGCVLKKTAQHLTEQLPEKWPGITNGSIFCPAKRYLLKGVQKSERHLAAIHIFFQYSGHLLNIYKTTRRVAAMLHNCTSNEQISATLTKIHDEDLTNWAKNKTYNMTVSSEVVNTMNARYIVEQIKDFGKCLQNVTDARFYMCVKKLSRVCGNRKNKKDKKQKKDRVRGKKGGKREKKERKNGRKNRRNRRGRPKTRKQRQQKTK